MGRKTPEDAAYRAVIDRIAAARFEQGLKQSEFGALIGLEQDAVSRVETYKRQLDLMEFKRACDVLGLDAAELLRGAPASSTPER
ncbi:MAG: Helix-turn-helix protein [Rhodospirillales bacterium]|jgi:transcriptional regulator with XRE-family HTH domain|nr:Helix-turn-helix protein [Rhodospirillales bacterium]